MKIFANIIRDGKIVKSHQIGTALISEDRISARKFNELKRSAMKVFPYLGKREFMTIVAEDGRVCKFSGYPSFSPYVRFL